MEAKDLMIDDWVACEGKNGKVKELREHKLSLKTENSVMIVYYNNVEPIPITSEILEKNGFVTDRYGEIELNDELGTSEINIVLEPTYSEEYYWWRINNNLIVKIKYVHELQHILKLVGIKKEVKL